MMWREDAEGAEWVEAARALLEACWHKEAPLRDLLAPSALLHLFDSFLRKPQEKVSRPFGSYSLRFGRMASSRKTKTGLPR